LDIAVSGDGQTAFILCEKSIKLYSIMEGKVTDTLPVTGSFSRIALSPDGETLLLTDAKNKQLSVMRVTPVYNIEIGQSPSNRGHPIVPWSLDMGAIFISGSVGVFQLVKMRSVQAVGNALPMTYVSVTPAFF